MVSSWHFVWFLLLIQLLMRTQARVAVDFSLLSSAAARRAAELYSTSSLFDVHSTATFRLRMKQKDMTALNIDQRAFEGQTNLLSDTKNRLTFVEAVLTNVTRNLNDDGKQLLHSLVVGPLTTTTITLVPNDDEFHELIDFLQAYKEFWRVVGSQTLTEVENTDKEVLSTSAEKVLEDFKLRALKSSSQNRQPKSFSPMVVDPEQLQYLSTVVFNTPRNSVQDINNAAAVRSFVRDRFEELGLVVTEHQFSTYETDFIYGEQLTGTNIVGILEGRLWKSGQDRPVVLGAHVDTVVGSPGWNDNGSGMAALLEAARMLVTAGCQFDNTIIFAAFDLEELGTQGSMMFVKDFIPKVLQDMLKTDKPIAALVMDCIANWDPSPNSQTFPDNWRKYLPEFVTRLASNGNTGDFISLIHRDGVDSFLAHRFARYYSRLPVVKYRLEMLPLKDLGPVKPDAESIHMHFDVLRSDHARFWYQDDNNYNATIPALLITDTGPYRGKMRECYHQPCDEYSKGDPVDFGMLGKTTEAVAWTAADLAGGSCGPRGRLNVGNLFRIASGFLTSDSVNRYVGNSELNDSDRDTRSPTTNFQEVQIPNGKKENDIETARKANLENIKSVTNALEMLHFLGVMPSIDQLTQAQLRSSHRYRAEYISPAKSERQNAQQGASASAKYILTSAERRGP